MSKEFRIPRGEHPRPQFMRRTWQNLNGEWEFCMDSGDSGVERGLLSAKRLEGKITVPFCPESELSGIGYRDFMTAVWYARSVDVSPEQLKGRVLLHFGAADYETHVYVNQQSAGVHRGGYTSFTFDITRLLNPGANRLVVRVRDDPRSDRQPVGKQSKLYCSHECEYTRTTGIWQTVWLEFVPSIYLSRVDVDATDLSGRVRLTARLSDDRTGLSLRVETRINGGVAALETFPLYGRVSTHDLTVKPVKLWDVGQPNLYSVTYTLLDGPTQVDTVTSYFGIRRIDIDGVKVRINGRSVFQRLILDQGYYPDGIYTAPTDAALERDIDLAMAVGYNGARLHQKVFEERYFYHADRKGYLVWGEFASWGIDLSDPTALHILLPEWLEVLERDRSHPCIIGWCPHNETWGFDARRPIDSNVSLIYDVTKAIDPTRPVIDTSGNEHTARTDIFDIHEYTQDPEKYRALFEVNYQGGGYATYPDRQTYGGQPYFISEFGGTTYLDPNLLDSGPPAGYGIARSEEEFCRRFCGLTGVLLDVPNAMGFCYTQLTDVEQERNGLYYYDRTPKFSQETYDKLREANLRTAEIEKDD